MVPCLAKDSFEQRAMMEYGVLEHQELYVPT